MTAPEPPRADPQVDSYRPLTWRHRLLIVALAVGTAVGVVLMLLDPPGGVQRKRAPAPQAATPPTCAPGQSENCVGGSTTILAPAAPAASR